MTKYPHKRIYDQLNLIASIHRHLKAKDPDNSPQKSAWNPELKKVKTIMEQWNDSDGNIHGLNNNTNFFAPLFE